VHKSELTKMKVCFRYAVW